MLLLPPPGLHVPRSRERRRRQQHQQRELRWRAALLALCFPRAPRRLGAACARSCACCLHLSPCLGRLRVRLRAADATAADIARARSLNDLLLKSAQD